MKSFSRIVFAVFVIAVVSACGKTDNQTATTEPAPGVVATVSPYLAAVANDARSENDRSRDADRKPAAVLEFFGIQPGMRVFDLFSGGGYYSELASYVVGPTGSITAHTNEAYAQFVGDEALTRFGGDRLPNVQILMAENNELKLNAGEYDAVLMVLAFHDIFYVDAKNGWPKIDGPALLAELYQGLKPGGVVGIVDHHAAAGSARETGGTLHRIDPAIVIADMRAAGFMLDGQTEILRNPADDHSLNMADPAVRGKTDRFVLRFVKPL